MRYYFSTLFWDFTGKKNLEFEKQNKKSTEHRNYSRQETIFLQKWALGCVFVDFAVGVEESGEEDVIRPDRSVLVVTTILKYTFTRIYTLIPEARATLASNIFASSSTVRLVNHSACTLILSSILTKP